jgi:pimeloyl-ACP methyl ester carboxylesterase
MLQAGPPDAREAVVFVHGNPGSSLDWTHLVRVAAAGGRRAVAFDMPGLGASDKPPTFPYTVAAEADFLGRALKVLGIDRVHLALHDFGGPFGLEWAKAHADALESVVLIDTGAFIGYFGHPLALVWHTPGAGEAAMDSETKETFEADVQSGNPRLLPQDFVDRMWDEHNHPEVRAAALKMYRSVSNPDKMGRDEAAVLSKRKRPALVIWGASDQYIPLYVAYEQDQAFPGARVEPLDSGHWPFVDNVEKVDALAGPFWRRVVPIASKPRRLSVRLQRLVRKRVARYRRLRARVCGGPAPHVRVRLYRRAHGKLRLAGSSRAVDLSRCSRVRVRLKQRLRRAARYRLVAFGTGLRSADVRFSTP